MAEQPQGKELIVVGDLNVYLKNTSGRWRDEDIVAAVAASGLEDLALPPAMAGVIQGLKDVGGGEAGEGSEIPDGLHHGIQPPDLPERGH